MTQDEELAQQSMLAGRDMPKAPRRRMSEWSVEVELLSTAVDRITELIQTVAASHGAKPSRVTPQPRPQTAIERVEHRERMRKHRSVVARVLPHKADQYQQQPQRNSTTGGERPPR